MNKGLIVLMMISLILAGVALFSGISGNVVKNYEENSLCGEDKILIDLFYDGDFVVLNKSLVRGCIPSYKHDLGRRYSYDLKAANQSLYESEFNPELIYSDIDAENEIEGGAENAERNIVLAAPSLENGEVVNLYDNGTKIMEINVYDVGARSCRID